MGWPKNRSTGLVAIDLAHASPGYTLISSLRGQHATLLDLDGRVVHRWHADEGISYAQLLPNGNLLARALQPENAGGVERIGCSAAAILELDWGSNIVWEYRNPRLHHDFVRCENGNTLAIAWHELPADVSSRVRGGQRHEDDPEIMWGDVVLDISPDGTVVDEWRSWEHLDPDEDVICPLERRREWSHANSIALNSEGDLLISFRQISTVGIVDRTTGEFTWKWGKDELSHQHDATFLDSGRVLIFDNGSHRRHQPSFSQVVEVDPETGKIVWTYKTDPLIAFYSYFGSSAERLPNGNTLINEGSDGHVFEVTPDGETVWEWISPFFFTSPYGTTSSLFRVHRVAPEHPALVGRVLDPGRYDAINRVIVAGEAITEGDRGLT